MNTLPIRIACWGFSKCSMSGCRWHYTRLWLKAKLCHESLLAMQDEQAAVGGIFLGGGKTLVTGPRLWVDTREML